MFNKLFRQFLMKFVYCNKILTYGKSAIVIFEMKNPAVSTFLRGKCSNAQYVFASFSSSSAFFSVSSVIWSPPIMRAISRLRSSKSSLRICVEVRSPMTFSR